MYLSIISLLFSHFCIFAVISQEKYDSSANCHSQGVHLLIYGGRGDHRRFLSDTWILDLVFMKWRPMRPRSTTVSRGQSVCNLCLYPYDGCNPCCHQLWNYLGTHDEQTYSLPTKSVPSGQPNHLANQVHRRSGKRNYRLRFGQFLCRMFTSKQYFDEPVVFSPDRR